ncbi:MAG: radical SAM protein [uncultured bacterium (gcode 4)]|uniref:Radical SAM protein n=1 Tax=uncultured bacterium (gcode 4) TaxID=1234023 RepID=K2FED1_9BACT|nr:MAG: radical SAM protein [uncultured bacterium (gcode 4)]
MNIKEVRHLVTQDCNLRCKHCYVAPEEWRIGETVHNYSQRFYDAFYWRIKPEMTSITGWEPLLKKDIVFKIARSIANYNWRVELVTNSYFLDSKTVDELNSINPKTIYQISLDWLEDYHNHIRWDAFAFEKVMRAIRLLLDKWAYIKIRLTATSENFWSIRQVIGLLEGYGSENIELVIRSVISKWNAIKNRLILDKDMNMSEITSPLIKVSITDNEWKCGCWIDTIAISPAWDIYPCTYFIWNDKFKMWNITDSILGLQENADFLSFNWACYARSIQFASL